MAAYHIPIMLNECLEALDIKPNGIYVDATFGGGGHSAAILEKLGSEGKLYSIDQDADAKANTNLFGDDKRFKFIGGNFRNIKGYLRILGVERVDGILADLGISSFQIDEPSRGFSTRHEGPLDMRMNQQSNITAHEVINNYPEKELHKILGMYGEVKNAKTLANAIVVARSQKKIETINEFKNILQKFTPKGKENKYLAQVFQAIRIEVNHELEALKELLEAAPQLLNEGGRLVIMSFHSLEDRLVKNFIRSGKFSGEVVEKNFYGYPIKPLEAISRGVITASSKEILENSRARSAKLRVATVQNNK